MRRIAHLSDVHFGRHVPAVVDALVSYINAAAPDLVVLSGDLTQRAKLDEFAEAKAFLGRIAAPLLVIPGNHDIPLYDAFTRFFRPFSRYHRFAAGAGVTGEAFFADREIAVLGLNTVRRMSGKNGRLSFAQLADIARIFANGEPAQFRIVVTHHPLASPADLTPRALAGRAGLALPVLVAAGVRLLLSGHYHRAGSGEVTVAGGGQLLVVHAGTAVSTRTRHEANSFNLISVADGVLTVEPTVYADGEGFRPGAAITYRLSDGRWTRAPVADRVVSPGIAV